MRPDVAAGKATADPGHRDRADGARGSSRWRRATPARIYNLFSLAEVQALIPAVDLKELLATLEGAPVPAQVQVIDVERRSRP